MPARTLPARHAIDVDAYYRMAEAGILAPDARVELIDGDIVDMVPIGSQHAGLTGRLVERLVHDVGSRASVRCQSPLRLSELDEPQPDVLVLRRRPGASLERHPTPEDVLLLVEVAGSSLAYDRGTKARLYAAAGIPEYWIVDLNGRSVEVHAEPSSDAYRRRTEQQSGVLRADRLPDVAIDLDRLLAGLGSGGEPIL